MGSKIRPRAADGLQCLPAGIPTTALNKKSPYVSIFGPSGQPINQTLDLSTPNPTFVPTRSPLTPSYFSCTGGGASGAHLFRRRHLQARRGTRRSSVLRISSRSWPRRSPLPCSVQAQLDPRHLAPAARRPVVPPSFSTVVQEPPRHAGAHRPSQPAPSGTAVAHHPSRLAPSGTARRSCKTASSNNQHASSSILI
jgi:hypothetical protein